MPEQNVVQPNQPHRAAGNRSGGARRKRGAKAWIPDQHGAWAMLILPPLLGAFTAGFNWHHLPFLLAWWGGYFLYQAWAKWVKVRGPRKAEYRAPLAVYGAVTGVGAVVSVATAPALLWWGAALAPLIAVAAVEVLRHNERSLLSGISTVLAAGLTLPIAVSLGPNKPHFSTPLGTPGAGMSDAAWIGTAILTAYFLGTVLHVKALIRERNSTAYWVATSLWHDVIALSAVAIAMSGPVWLSVRPLALWLQVPLWIGLAARTWTMVRNQHRGKRYTPKQIGVPEIAISLVVGASVVPFLLG
ncbi:MAG: YwiC-like family protein [Buchananella hordeovulneris]|nr:YwiC-like family protein [Buchananella hordeovulneris]